MKRHAIHWTMMLFMFSVIFASCEKTDETGTSSAPSSYTLTVLPNRAEYGITTGSGTYMKGESVDIEAEAYMGYYFIRWSDGNATNPRTVVVNSKLTLYALFSDRADDPNPYNPANGQSPDPDPEPLQTEGWVSLGLPSGLLWATCNVGASSPEDFGDYFAWGETQTKDTFSWNTYQYGIDYNKLTKYCCNAENGLNGYTDNLTVLEPGDDAATVCMGGGARTPTKRDWEELLDNTTCRWTTWNGVSGCRFTAANGKAIFLPAAGYHSYTVGHDVGTFGDYWSSSLSTNDPSKAWKAFFGQNKLDVNAVTRSYGFSVRAVRSIQ